MWSPWQKRSQVRYRIFLYRAIFTDYRLRMWMVWSNMQSLKQSLSLLEYMVNYQISTNKIKILKECQQVAGLIRIPRNFLFLLFHFPASNCYSKNRVTFCTPTECFAVGGAGLLWLGVADVTPSLTPPKGAKTFSFINWSSTMTRLKKNNLLLHRQPWLFFQLLVLLSGEMHFHKSPSLSLIYPKCVPEGCFRM